LGRIHTLFLAGKARCAVRAAQSGATCKNEIIVLPVIRRDFMMDSSQPSKISIMNAKGKVLLTGLIALCFTAITKDLYGDEVSLEDSQILVSFDSSSGALIRMEDKSSNWLLERRPELGVSFRLFAPLPNRRYNPVLGEKQQATEVKKLSDHEIELQWTNLVSENGGVLPIALTAEVTLTNDVLTFSATLENNSSLTVETIDYPYFGDFNPPSRDSGLAAYARKLGQFQPDELYPHFRNEKGYWGVNWPTKMLEPQNSHFCLVQSADEGLYVGTKNPADYRVQYVFEQHPGLVSGMTSLVPPEDEFSGWPVFLQFRVCHFIFAKPDSTSALSPVNLRCYQGDWRAGASNPK
jgi:hypothetical protein